MSIYIFLILLMLTAKVVERWNVPVYYREGQSCDHFKWRVNIGVNPVSCVLCSTLVVLYLVLR